MVDTVLAFASAREEKTKTMMVAYEKKCNEITNSRGMRLDPNADDRITDETIMDRLLNGRPEIPVFLLPDINDARDIADLDTPLHGFIEADGIGYVPLRSSNSGVSYIEDRFDEDAFYERLDHMGTFATNSTTLAVIDGTGKMFLAANNERNRVFFKR